MIKNVLIAFGVVVISFIIAADAHAQSATSTLSQQITPTDCILTVVANGNGSQSIGDCDNGEPQVTEVEYTASGQRFIRGVFDSSNTSILRVFFRGAVYISNTPNSPLKTVGDSWSLSLNQITPEVESGTYTLTVETDMLDGTTLSETTTITLPPVSYGEADPGFVPLVPNAPATNGWSFLRGIASPNNIANSSYGGMLGNTQQLLFLDDGTGKLLPMPKLLVDTLLLLAGLFVIAVLSTILSIRKRHLG
jgi:hypothetical protein